MNEFEALNVLTSIDRPTLEEIKRIISQVNATIPHAKG